MRYLVVILCSSALYFTSEGQTAPLKNVRTEAALKNRKANLYTRTKKISSAQEAIYHYLTTHLFYLGTTESDYEIESRVYFNGSDSLSKPGLKTGTLQIYVDGSSSYMTGSFEVAPNGEVSLYHVLTHDPNTEQTHAMKGKIVKFSDTIYELTLKAPNSKERIFYLITL